MHHRLAVFALSLSEVLRPVEVVLNVGNLASKMNLFASLAPLNRVSLDISWANHHFTRVLVTLEVLLNLNVVGHVDV